VAGHARAFASDFANIGVCILYNVVLLPLIAWFTVLVSLLSTVFAYTYEDGMLRPDPSIGQLFCFLVYLPVLWLVVTGYQRRNSAQAALNKCELHDAGGHTRGSCRCSLHSRAHAGCVCLSGCRQGGCHGAARGVPQLLRRVT
jgi:hypothetical protein